MATYTFPADVFTVEGDPEGVRESGRAYGRFASLAGEAAATLGGLDSGGWVGSEGDLFRARVAEIPPHLVTACTAFGQVSRGLDDFAEVLASAQRRMAGARDQAEQTFGSLAGARADRAGLEEPTDTQATDLDARIGRLEIAWDEQLAVAAGIRAQVLEAARRGAVAIRAAGRTSPTADQNWFQDGWEKGTRWASERLDDLKGFMAEHAGWLRGLAKVLRVVGIVLVAVGAVLAIFGVGGAVMAAGFVAWGAGDVLDTTVDWAEGKISGRELLFRAGTAILLTAAGGVAAKVGAKLLERLGPRVRRLIGARPGRLDQWEPGKPLPQAPAAAIDDRKFLQYSMDPGNARNRGKWKVWSELGYDVDDLTNRAAASDDVIRQVREQLERLPAREGRDTQYGRRFEVEIPITGPNGRSGTLFTAWQFDAGSTIPRMITNWLKVHA
jgi:uncharacterized protein DUF6883/type VII secretion system ESX-1 substrate